MILFAIKTELISFIYSIHCIRTDYGRYPAETIMQSAFLRAASKAHEQLVDHDEADWDLMGSLTEELTNEVRRLT